MAESVSAITKFVRNSEFQGRIALLMAKISIEVLAEANSIPNHNVRAAYANLVLNNLSREGQRAATVVISNNISTAAAATNHEAFSDADLETALEAVFNALAGIFTPEA